VGPRDVEREELGREVKQAEYGALLQRLRTSERAFRRFRSWESVAVFMRKGASDDPRKDDVLRPILAAHAADRDARWRTILLFLFWSRLKAACIRRSSLDQDAEVLWGNTVWAFLRAVCEWDIARRPDRLFQGITNTTTWRLSREYQRARRRNEIEMLADPSVIEYLAGETVHPGFAEVDLRDEHEHRTARFSEQLKAGRITEADFHLLVGTLVYGRLLRECAEEIGLNYQLAKKRRQRAELAIRRFESSEKRRKTCPHPPDSLPSVCLETNVNADCEGGER